MIGAVSCGAMKMIERKLEFNNILKRIGVFPVTAILGPRQHGGKNWGVELKYADAPKLMRSMKIGLEDLELEHLWVVYPGKETYKLSEDVTVMPLPEIPETWVAT
jgi:hypothetical protein